MAKIYEDNYYDSKGNVLGTYTTDGKGTAYDKATGKAMRELYGDSNVKWTQSDKPNEKGLWGTITVNVPTPTSAPAPKSSSKNTSAYDWTPTRSSLRDAADVAKTYGDITYDQDAIKALFDKATKEKYKLLNKEYLMSENKYYDALAGTGSTALDTLRRSASAAIATGASRGMQAATELSALLGLEQQGVADATALVQERNKLADKQAAEVAQNAVEALQYANQTKFNLGNLSSNLYAADTQFDVGQMDYYARLDTAMKALQGQLAMADAQKYAADKGLSGTEYNAFMNLVGNTYSANKNYDSNTLTAIINKMAQEAVAQKNYDSNKYSVDNYKAPVYGGGSSGSGYTQQPQVTPDSLIQQALATGNKSSYIAIMASSGVSPEIASGLWDTEMAKWKKGEKTDIHAPKKDVPVVGSTEGWLGDLMGPSNWIKNADGTWKKVKWKKVNGQWVIDE